MPVLNLFGISLLIKDSDERDNAGADPTEGAD